MTADDIADLLESWTLHLMAQRKSRQTIKAYRDGVTAFLRWAEQVGVPPELDRRTVNAFVAHLLAAGAAAQTALLRQAAVRRLSAWAADEGELAVDQLVGLKPPKVDEAAVVALTDDELRALLATCSSRSFLDRRDEALMRVLAESMLRAEEALSMTLGGTRVKEGRAVVVRGKGGVGRVVPFGVQTARALDRYLRVRKTHHLADTDVLWLGDRNASFGYGGLAMAVARRGRAAGLDRKVHPHMFRHTGATRWLAAGGTEGGVMAVAGWKNRKMIDRYTKAARETLAAAEAQRLGLGDI